MNEREKGKFIVFEGIGGCGKSSQIEPARDYIASLGYDVVATREPGGTVPGEKIRNYIFTLKGEDFINSDQQMILFFASRYLLLNDLIIPKLKEGSVVLSDRLYPSTGAYQGYGEGVDMDKILKTAEVTFGINKPDAVFLFDIFKETAVERNEKEDDPFDRMDIEYFQRVIEGYREMAETGWGNLNWYVVNGELSISEVSANVRIILDGILNTSQG